MRRTRRESPHAARAWTGRERAHTLGTCLGSGVDIRDERMRAGGALFCVNCFVCGLTCMAHAENLCALRSSDKDNRVYLARYFDSNLDTFLLHTRRTLSEVGRL
jgi:hypothetical protein